MMFGIVRLDIFINVVSNYVVWVLLQQNMFYVEWHDMFFKTEFCNKYEASSES